MFNPSLILEMVDVAPFLTLDLARLQTLIPHKKKPRHKNVNLVAINQINSHHSKTEIKGIEAEISRQVKLEFLTRTYVTPKTATTQKRGEIWRAMTQKLNLLEHFISF